MQVGTAAHKFLNTAQVSKLLNLTERQIQYWDESGLINPTNLNRERRFSPELVRRMTVFCALREKKMPLRQVRIIDEKIFAALKPVPTTEETYLITDGAQVTCTSHGMTAFLHAVQAKRAVWVVYVRAAE